MRKEEAPSVTTCCYTAALIITLVEMHQETKGIGNMQKDIARAENKRYVEELVGVV